MITNISTRITRLSVLAAAALVAGAAFAAPPVTVTSERFVTAKAMNAVKAFHMKDGYKGDAAAKDLADKLFKAAHFSDVVSLKDDGSNHMLHVSKNDPSAHFRIDKTTGDFSLSKGIKGYLNDQATAGLPDTNDKAVDAAKRHLTELGLMPADQKQLVLRHVGGLNQGDLVDGKSVDRKKLVTVHFGRQIDGIDVGGPGSKIVVDLGANGELVGVTKRWSELTEEKKNDSDLHTQGDVTNALKTKLQNDGAHAKTIDSSGPDFGYFDDGKGNVEPAYFFNAELTYDSADGGATKQFKEKYHGAVPALKGSKADFTQLAKAKSQPGKSQTYTQDKASQKDH
jgi:hypothetical protein